jgi:hypothetical protein
VEVPKQKRGVLLFFPSRESATPRPTTERCLECERLEEAIDDAVGAIHQAIRGPASLGEKLREMHRKQDERDQLMLDLYDHQANVHARKSA